VVRDPGSAGLLTVVLLPLLLSCTCAFRAWVMLAVERERQVTIRLAIGWLAGARKHGVPSPCAGEQPHLEFAHDRVVVVCEHQRAG
jgi:hypothetical protein